MSRRTFARAAAPAAFLLGVTIVVLLVRAGLEHRPAAPPPPARAVLTTPEHRARPKRGRPAAPAGARYVTVRRGDTFSSIAAAAGIDLARLEALNPGVDPYSLHAGERIRVR